MELLYEQADDFGNKLMIYQDAREGRVLKLKLCDEAKLRFVGSINLEKRVMEVRREKKKHLYRATNSYGFNYKIIHDGLTFDTVILRDETDTYSIPRTFIDTHGKMLLHKEKGFERQLFVALEELVQFRLNENMF